jgi:uncharacterized protein involved in outer membrane biogenesis
MKTFGKAVAILLAIVVILFVGAILFLKGFDWDRARPTINEKVSAATGRRFVIGGHLTATWKRPATETGLRSLVPWPTFTAENVQIDNPEWAKRRQFASADAIEFEVEILPLLAHRIVIPHIALRNPVVDMERTTDGKNTWTFTRAPQAKSKWDLELQELAFADGVVDVIDQPTRIDMRATVATIGAPIALGTMLEQQKANAVTPAAESKAGAAPAVAKAPPSQPATVAPAGKSPAAESTAGDKPAYGFAVTLAGTYRDAKLAGDAKVGGVLSLIDRQRPFPLHADVHLGDNHVIADGTLTDPAKLGAIDVALSVEAPSMGDLYDLIGVALPDTPKFRTKGHLTGNFNGSNRHFKYEKFTGEVGRSDLAGTLEFTSAPPRSRLTGNVHSKRLALADLGPAIGAPTATAKAPAKGKTDKAIPTAAFKTDRWRAMDMDVQFSGASIIRTASLPITDMTTHVKMDDGVLTFDPLKFGVAGGSVTGTMRLDGRKAPLDGKLDVAARHLQLKRLFPTFAPMNTSFGEINGDAKLTGRGNSSAALAASSNGEVKLLINDGAISNTLLEEAGLNVANIVAAKLFGDKVVQINCAAADFVVKDGLLDSRVFAFDTVDALINVEGTINLSNEQMALNVYPHTKGFRVFSLRSPLYVRGTFKKPDVGVMTGPLALRGAAALALGAVNPFAALLALVAPSNKQASPCPAMMATASQGLKGAPAISRKAP